MLTSTVTLQAYFKLSSKIQNLSRVSLFFIFTLLFTFCENINMKK